MLCYFIKTAALLAGSCKGFFYIIRESQEETTYSSRSKLLKEYLDFERQVVELIKKYGGKISPTKLQDRGYDFQVSIGDKNILVEIKTMSRRLPLRIILHMIEELSEAIEMSGADEGVIITNAPFVQPRERMETKSVRVLSLKEFRNYLSHG